MCPGRSSATHATKRITINTHGLSILLAPELIWHFSYNGFVSKIAIAFPYLRLHGGRPFLYAKRAHFPHSFRSLHLRIPPRVLHFCAIHYTIHSPRNLSLVYSICAHARVQYNANESLSSSPSPPSLPPSLPLSPRSLSPTHVMSVDQV